MIFELLPLLYTIVVRALLYRIAAVPMSYSVGRVTKKI